jgi:hypothetical protein
MKLLFYLLLFMSTFEYHHLAHALIPLENVALGDFSQEYDEELFDPLDYYLNKNANTSSDLYKYTNSKETLALYRGFYQEGENLANVCKMTPKIIYPTYWTKIQAKRSVISTLQYIGLDITSRAIPQFAKYFQFSNEEYTNLVEDLVGNYCSDNITVIGKKQLKKYLHAKFNNKNNFKLPSYGNNELVPDELKSINSEIQINKQEFLMTTYLFKAFCSWGNDTENYRLLAPILKHKGVMAFVHRKMNNKSLKWNYRDNSLSLVKKESKIHIVCHNLICRKAQFDIYKEKFPRALGGSEIQDDLDRLYCKDFKNPKPAKVENSKKIKKLNNQLTFDEKSLMVAQFISLITGVPDLLVRSISFNDAKQYLRVAMDKAWGNWSKNQLAKLQKDIFYEEPLNITVTNQKQYKSPLNKNFTINLDINLGEFDKALFNIGKLKTIYKLKITKNFLGDMQEKAIVHDPRNKEEKKKIIKRIVQEITPQIQECKSYFDNPPWEEGLENLIAHELFRQLYNYKGRTFENKSIKPVEIPITFHYGLFAMKYIRYKDDIKNRY